MNQTIGQEIATSPHLIFLSNSALHSLSFLPLSSPDPTNSHHALKRPRASLRRVAVDLAAGATWTRRQILRLLVAWCGAASSTTVRERGNGVPRGRVWERRWRPAAPPPAQGTPSLQAAHDHHSRDPFRRGDKDESVGEARGGGPQAAHRHGGSASSTRYTVPASRA